jgi:hypothetical protein
MTLSARIYLLFKGLPGISGRPGIPGQKGEAGEFYGRKSFKL